MKILLHLIHATSSARALYEAAFRARGLDVDVVTVLPPAAAGGALSSAYAELCVAWGLDGLTPLEGLLRDYPGKGGPYGAWVLASWSAGYKLIERALGSHDAGAVQGAVMLDSGYAAFDPDHTASDRQIEPFVELARRAVAGEALLWIGHTDVQTPQRGRGAYASTDQWAAEVLRLGARGVVPPAAPNHAGLGLLRVQAFNLEPADRAKAEHTRALLDWGPAFVGDALLAWVRARSEAESKAAGGMFEQIRQGVAGGAEDLGS